MKTIQFFVIASFLMASACSKDEPLHPQPSNLTEEIENIIQPMVNDKITVGAAIGIIKPGGQKEMFFFGEKIENQGERPDENTLFEIGSINKTMTSAILADMVLKGEVNLDDAVEAYLPGVSNFPHYDGQRIAFKHLANHTSSLPRLPDNAQNNVIDKDQPFAYYTKEMMYDFLGSYALPRAIGSEEEYSNFAFGLLGHTLGEMRGTSFDNQLQEIVFKRLGMNNSFSIIPADYNNLAQPYNDKRKPVPGWIFSDVFLGAGGVKSSLKDMLTYLEANMGHGDSDMKEALALSHQNTQMLHDPNGTGLAWVNGFNTEKNMTLTAHNGGTAGSVAFIGFINELDMGVVLLFNTNIIGRTSENSLETRKAVQILEAMQKY
jgi:CubicO group peptidase (beta-lactamase class C family)